MPRRFKANQAHFNAFSEQQRLRFEDEMLSHLRRLFGDVLARRDDDWVRMMTGIGIEQAAEHGIVLERDVTRYLELMLAISPDYDDSDETPWARNILADPSSTAEEKLDRIDELVLFGEQGRGSGKSNAGRAPRPFCHDAVQAADVRFRTEYPGVEPTRLTMSVSDGEYRAAWMLAYRHSLDDLSTHPATSRPYAKVGAPVAKRSDAATGSLTVTLVDAETSKPVTAASVQISGPVVERTLSSFSGQAEFQGIEIGEYTIVAADAQHRCGQGSARVERGLTRVRVACRQPGRMPQE